MSSSVEHGGEPATDSSATTTIEDAQPWYPDEPDNGDGGGPQVGGPDDPSVDTDPGQPWWQRPLNIVAMVVTSAICFALIGWSVGSSRQNAHNAVDVGFLQDMRTHHEQATYMSLIYLGRPDTDPRIQAIAVSILQGQNIEIGWMIQMLRMFGEPEAANLDEPPMQWMNMAETDDDTTDDGQSVPHSTEMAMDHSEMTDTTVTTDDDDTPFMPGMATDAELDQLEASSGATADALFVRLMIAHHRGGIAMADYEVEHGRNADVKEMAEAMAHGQRSEIVEMSDLIPAG